MHIPVLLNEVLQFLDPKPDENFIDCTVGEGGHALAILKLIAPNGRLLGIDRDADMIERLEQSAERLALGDRFAAHHGNFADIAEIARKYDFSHVNGILFDFGMSSWQLEESGAGFSFQNIEPLDMRFDRTRDTDTAAVIVNSWPEKAIERVLHDLGEERYAMRISKEIVMARKRERIETTDQLVNIISRAVPTRPLRQAQGKRVPGKHRKQRGIHFATRTFQALRIAVNSELENVEKGLHDAINLLSSGGKIAAISFHSLEDRRVKNIFREYSRVEGGPLSPEAEEGKRSPSRLLKIITKKPVRASAEEIKGNPRARSAKLRVAEKL